MLAQLTEKQNEDVCNVLKDLSLREIIGQTAIWHIGRLPFSTNDQGQVESFLKQYPVGTIFMADMPSEHKKTLTQTIANSIACFQRASKIPLLAAGDLEHGAGSAAKELTRFSDMLAIGAADDLELDYLFGKYTAIEGRAVGFNWSFSPVVDLLKNWLNPVVSNRCMGDDHIRVSAYAEQIIKGMQDYGMAACAKHFPGDGVDFLDQHVCTSVNSLSEDEWFSTYGHVFQRAIDAGVMSIMLGHIALPWLESFHRDKGRYAPGTVSKPIVTDLLRNRLNFKGLIVSDALDMGGYTGWGTYQERIVASINSGIDAMLWPEDNYFDLVEEAINDGRINKNRIIDAATRVLEMKARLGLLDCGEIPAAGNIEPLKEAMQVSKAIADKSISLVRNTKGLLPLNPDKTKRILIGNLAKITNDKYFPIDYFVEQLRNRGIYVHVLEDLHPVTVKGTMEKIGLDWDAFIMPYILRTHGLVNTVRPVGASATAFWAMQSIENLNPIVVSFSTPYLLRDMPYLQTYVNAYSNSVDSVNALIKALFGEIEFCGCTPVKNVDPLQHLME